MVWLGYEESRIPRSEFHYSASQRFHQEYSLRGGCGLVFMEGACMPETLTIPISPLTRTTSLRGMPAILGASPVIPIEQRRLSSLRQRRVVRQAGQPFIIMVALQKGGVAKTETVACLAVLFRLKGLRVLVVELDAQGDAAYSLGIEVKLEDPTSLEVLHYANQGYGFRYALKSSPFGVWVVPANFRLSEHANLLTTATSRELLLARALVDDGVEQDFDVVLIDCPPAFGLPTMCAAAVANVAEIPLQLHNRAWRALSYFE